MDIEVVHEQEGWFVLSVIEPIKDGRIGSRCVTRRIELMSVIEVVETTINTECG